MWTVSALWKDHNIKTHKESFGSRANTQLCLKRVTDWHPIPPTLTLKSFLVVILLPGPSFINEQSPWPDQKPLSHTLWLRIGSRAFCWSISIYSLSLFFRYILIKQCGCAACQTRRDKSDLWTGTAACKSSKEGPGECGGRAWRGLMTAILLNPLNKNDHHCKTKHRNSLPMRLASTKSFPGKDLIPRAREAV